MSKVRKFYLRCDPSARFFYGVEIHPTKKSMLRSIRRLEGSSKHAEDSRAVCLRFELKEKPQDHEQIGILYFVKTDMSTDVVVHELTHAACGWARRVGIDTLGPRKRHRYLNDPEERFAREIQFLVQQFGYELQKQAA